MELYEKNLAFYRAKLKRFALSFRQITGLPATVNLEFLQEQLFWKGFVVISKINGDIVALDGALSGVGLNSQPTTYTSTAPIAEYSGKVKTIGVDCAVIRNTPSYKILEPMELLVNHYAERLAIFSTALGANANAVVTGTLIKADSHEQRQALVKAYNEIKMGEPVAVLNSAFSVLEKGNGSVYDTLNTKDVYIGDKLQEGERNIMRAFLTELGINNVPVEKAERLITSESESNNDELYVSSSRFFEGVQQGLDDVNRIFGLQCKVEPLKEGGKQNAETV